MQNIGRRNWKSRIPILPLISLCLLLLPVVANACVCDKQKPLKEARIWNIEQSEVIFLGELIHYTDSTYRFKIVEAFKGIDPSETYIDGDYNTSCSLIPNTEGQWLVYARGSQNIDISFCSLSRPKSRPTSMNAQELHIVPPPPPPINPSESQLQALKVLRDSVAQAMVQKRKKTEQLFSEEIKLLQEKFANSQPSSPNSTDRGSLLWYVGGAVLLFLTFCLRSYLRKQHSIK